MSKTRWAVVPQQGLRELKHRAIVDALGYYLGAPDALSEWKAACQRCGVRPGDERPESLLLALQVLADTPGPVGVSALAVRARLSAYGTLEMRA
jgi:hypothetical protein